MNVKKITKHILSEIQDLILHAYSYISGESSNIPPALRELDKANRLLAMLIEEE